MKDGGIGVGRGVTAHARHDDECRQVWSGRIGGLFIEGLYFFTLAERNACTLVLNYRLDRASYLFGLSTVSLMYALFRESLEFTTGFLSGSEMKKKREPGELL